MHLRNIKVFNTHPPPILVLLVSPTRFCHFFFNLRASKAIWPKTYLLPLDPPPKNSTRRSKQEYTRWKFQVSVHLRNIKVFKSLPPPQILVLLVSPTWFCHSFLIYALPKRYALKTYILPPRSSSKNTLTCHFQNK